MGAYIIAEAGVNHNGRLDLAKELCLAAKNAGADCVKFQTWQTEKIITRSVAQADYQADNTAAPSPSSICSSGWSFPMTISAPSKHIATRSASNSPPQRTKRTVWIFC